MATQRKRVVISVAGSPHDNKQLATGLEVLAGALAANAIVDYDHMRMRDRLCRWFAGENRVGHYTISAHRNRETLSAFLDVVAECAKESEDDTDFYLPMAAGLTAVLPGVAAGYLCHHLRVRNVFVLGVALESGKPIGNEHNISSIDGAMSALQIIERLTAKQIDDLAAILAITRLPELLFINADAAGTFFGADGFRRACTFAVTGDVSDEFRHQIADLKTKPPAWKDWKGILDGLATAV